MIDVKMEVPMIDKSSKGSHKKNIFCLDILKRALTTPNPPIFLNTYEELFLNPISKQHKFLIIFGLYSSPQPLPLENVQTKAEKVPQKVLTSVDPPTLSL